MNAEEEYEMSEKRTRIALVKYLESMGTTIGGEWTAQPGLKYADYDFKIFQNGIFNHFLEVKVRNHIYGAYQMVMLPVRKHAFAEHEFNAYGIKTYFLMAFSNGMGVLDLTFEPDKEEEKTGRYDRENYQDVYVFYDIAKVTPIIDFAAVQEENEESFKDIFPDE